MTYFVNHTLQNLFLNVYFILYFINYGHNMDDKQFSCIAASNYWDQPPQVLGFLRVSYVSELMAYLDNNLIKVLVGQRRCGKSTLLKQTIAQLLQQGVANQNILYLNFELHDLQFIKQATTLAESIKQYYTRYTPKGRVYLFFDEIQEVEEWEEVINSYFANEKFDVEIFLTGSNAHLLSSELSTYVTGRYVEIPIYPLSYKEYLEREKLSTSKQNLIHFIESSGIPELNNLKDDRQRRSYLMALKDSIVINDIVKRYAIKNPKLLMLLLDFMIDNVGHLFSINAITRKLNTIGVNINVVTVGNYIHYLEKTFIVHAVSRYDLRGKKILEGERKYFLNDLGFMNYLQSTFDNGINRKLENHVFLTLLQADFTVYVGNIQQHEIDFVAIRNQQTIYIQVAYLLHSEEVIKREYGNLEKISDAWPRWVVSLDDVEFAPKNGIKHIPAWKLNAEIEKL